MQLQNIGLDKVQFVTVPTEYYPTDSEFCGKVFWTPEADQIWKLINEDKPLPARACLKGTSVSAEPPPGASRDAVAERRQRDPVAVRDAVARPRPRRRRETTASDDPVGDRAPTRDAQHPGADHRPEDRIFGVCA